MSSSSDELSAELQQLRAGTLPEDAIFHTIHELGRAKAAEAIPDIERFLTHEDPQYRYVALEVLTHHFHLAHHWASAAQALRHDPDEHVRIGAASALCALQQNTQDAMTLGELARVVADENEEAFVRQTAWSAMLGVIKWDWQEQRRLARQVVDLEQEVDWALVQQYLASNER